jgi:hypothetical protein
MEKDLSLRANPVPCCGPVIEAVLTGDFRRSYMSDPS